MLSSKKGEWVYILALAWKQQAVHATASAAYKAAALAHLGQHCPVCLIIRSLACSSCLETCFTIMQPPCEQCMCREQRQLNALIRQYLTVHGLKSTAMTLAEEAAGQLPSQDSLSSDLPTLVELWQGRSEAGDARTAAEVMQHFVDVETVLP